MLKQGKTRAKLSMLNLTVLLGIVFLNLFVGGIRTGSSSTAQAAGDETSSYNWSALPIGGGGAVPEVLFHPKIKDLAYMRTDVGGAYRWDATNKKWIQLLTGSNFPYSYNGYTGVGSIAVFNTTDSTQKGVILAAVGSDSKSTTPKGQIFKSFDYGQTWSGTGLFTWVGSNYSQKIGSRLAVDPNNYEVVYYASREGKLWRSFSYGDGIPNGPTTFQEITGGSVPSGDITNLNQTYDSMGKEVPPGRSGLEFVAFDEKSPVLAASGGKPARTSTLYIGAHNDGIYKSSDGGDTWTKITASGVGPDPAKIHKADVDQTNTLYVSSLDGFWKYKNGTWTAFSTFQGKSILAFAVDPRNAQRILAVRHSFDQTNYIYYTSNGGTSWDSVQKSDGSHTQILHDSTSWTNPPLDYFAQSIFSIAFDPFDDTINPSTGNPYTDRTQTVWFSDYYTVWTTDKFWANTTDWYNYKQGHEEIVSVMSPVSLPSSAGPVRVISGTGDTDGFAWTSLTNFPAKTVQELGFNTNVTLKSIDYAENNPSFVVAVGLNGHDVKAGDVHEGNGGYSTNGGQTFTPFPTRPNVGVNSDGTNPSGMGQGGRIAVSYVPGTSNYRIAWVVGAKLPYYSDNLGQTWTVATGAPSATITRGNFASKNSHFAADRINSTKLYLYAYDKTGTKGKLFVSLDGGASYNQANTDAADPNPLPNVDPNAQDNFLHLHTPYGDSTMANRVWIAMGDKGLWHSTDGGVHFTKLSNVQNAIAFDFGKAASGRTNPAMFVLGKVDGATTDALYRSDDMGVSWVKISKMEGALANGSTNIGGDRQLHGMVYVATSGNGILYGQK